MKSLINYLALAWQLMLAGFLVGLGFAGAFFLIAAVSIEWLL